MGPRRNIAILFGTKKLESWGYPVVKCVEDMFSGVIRIPACDVQTDRDILQRHSPCYAYASRGKNRDLGPISRFISEMVQHGAIVRPTTPIGTRICDLPNGAISNELE